MLVALLVVKKDYAMVVSLAGDSVVSLAENSVSVKALLLVVNLTALYSTVLRLTVLSLTGLYLTVHSSARLSEMGRLQFNDINL